MYCSITSIARLLALLAVQLNSSSAQPQVDLKVNKIVETIDGCPYPYDFGKFGYSYKKPKICQTLLPADLASVPQQSSKEPFSIVMETTDDNYFQVILSVLDGFNETITGAVIRIQRLAPNGKAILDTSAGHLEGSPPWGTGYCCNDSKFKTLLSFFKNPGEVGDTRMEILWYTMNFAEGRLIFIANIFAETRLYWQISSMQYKIPILPPIITAADDDYY